MPNIDALSHDMTFTIGGETFEVHDVHPDVLATWDDDDAEADRRFDEALKARDEALKNGVPVDQLPPLPKEDPLARYDKRILAFLNGDADAVKRYRALRKRKTDPVPAWRVTELYRQMVETQTRRPTQQPSPSGNGRGQTAPTSGGA